jgi:hypothetical protein
MGKTLHGIHRLFRATGLHKMDDHIAKMLNDGWEILTQTSHAGDWRTLLPFAKRDTITISFGRK